MTCDYCPSSTAPVIAKRSDGKEVIVLKCECCDRIRQYPANRVDFVSHILEMLQAICASGNYAIMPQLFCYDCNTSVSMEKVASHYPCKGGVS